MQKARDFEGPTTHVGPLPLDSLVAAETLARPFSPAPVTEPDADPESIGRYEVRGVLGEGYMAPEQLSRGLVHAQSDLYSLAVVAHEVLTGVRPFRRPSLGALLQSIVADEPPRASGVNPALPAAVDQVLAKALAKAPEKRYPDGRAFMTALRGAFGRAKDSKHS